MNHIENYFNSVERSLREEFERIRKTKRDTDVKGTGNEKILKEFLERHISARFIATNVEIIDAAGNSSAEVDVCVCNEDQPFSPQPSQPVIAEGVDFVVQVKAVITTNEIDRIINNCVSVKNLKRTHSKGDMMMSPPNLISHTVDRILFIGFAFSSRLKLKTIRHKLQEKLQGVALQLQPDAIFVLNSGSIINCRDGDLSWTRFLGQRTSIN